MVWECLGKLNVLERRNTVSLLWYQSLVAGKGMTKADKLARNLIIRLQRDNRQRYRIEKITFMEGYKRSETS